MQLLHISSSLIDLSNEVAGLRSSLVRELSWIGSFTSDPGVLKSKERQIESVTYFINQLTAVSELLDDIYSENGVLCKKEPAAGSEGLKRMVEQSQVKEPSFVARLEKDVNKELKCCGRCDGHNDECGPDNYI